MTPAPYPFSARHIGPSASGTRAMLAALGVPSLETLISQAVPKSIRLERALALPLPASEAEALGELSATMAKNTVLKSFIGAGYHGGLDLRGGRLDGGHLEADAHLLGLALRGRGGALVAVSGGIGVGGVRGLGATRAPLELAVELPLGPTRALARAGLAWRLGGVRYADDVRGVADEASAAVGVRLGRDRRYWTEVVAGGGPFLVLTYRDLGGAELYGVAVGLGLWGGT